MQINTGTSHNPHEAPAAQSQPQPMMPAVPPLQGPSHPQQQPQQQSQHQPMWVNPAEQHQQQQQPAQQQTMQQAQSQPQPAQQQPVQQPQSFQHTGQAIDHASQLETVIAKIRICLENKKLTLQKKEQIRQFDMECDMLLAEIDSDLDALVNFVELADRQQPIGEQLTPIEQQIQRNQAQAVGQQQQQPQPQSQPQQQPAPQKPQPEARKPEIAQDALELHWAEITLQQMGFPEGLVTLLAANPGPNITTFGALQNYLSNCNSERANEVAKLTELAGVGKAKAEAVLTARDRFWKVYADYQAAKQQQQPQPQQPQPQQQPQQEASSF